jgi:hypothetical protein
MTPRGRALAAWGVAVGALLIAWAFAGPPGYGPDEPSHYVRALGAGSGHVTGEKFVATAAERAAFGRQAASKQKALGGTEIGGAGGARRLHWLSRVMRRFPVPRKLSDISFTGSGPRADTLASQTGSYQPYSLLAAGVAMRAGHDAPQAIRVGRLVQAAFAFAMLLAAAALLYDARAPGVSLAGLIAAATPMVIFTGAIVSPSGPEIAGAIGFTAAGLRLLRDEDPAPPGRLAWLVLAVSGAALASARTLGPLYVALIVLALLGLAGRERLAAAWRAGGGSARAAAAVVALAITAGLVWELTVMPHPATSVSRLLDEVGPSIRRLPGLLREAVGIFGGLDSKLPAGAFAAWLALGAAVIGAGVRFGTRRERGLALALLAAAPVITVALSVSQLQTGFGLQGRHVLGLLAVVPLVCGEIVLRRREEVLAGWRIALGAGVPALAGVVQGIGWLANAHHFAGGSWLLRGTSWAPPAGWALWTVLAALGAAGYLALAAIVSRSPEAQAAASAVPASR